MSCLHYHNTANKRETLSQIIKKCISKRKCVIFISFFFISPITHQFSIINYATNVIYNPTHKIVLLTIEQVFHWPKGGKYNSFIPCWRWSLGRWKWITLFSISVTRPLNSAFSLADPKVVYLDNLIQLNI